MISSPSQDTDLKANLMIAPAKDTKKASHNKEERVFLDDC